MHDQIAEAELICQRWWKCHGSDFRQGLWLTDLLGCETTQCQTACVMVQRLLALVKKWRNGDTDIPLDLIRDKVLIALFQCLTRLLLTQNEDGSWGLPSFKENETRAGLQCITQLATLSITEPIKTAIDAGILSARLYLQVERLERIEEPPVDLSDITDIPSQRLPKLEAFYASLSYFKNTPCWVLRASIVEGFLFRSMLTSPDHMLFHDKDESKWLEYVMSVLPAVNNTADFVCSTEVLFGQMLQLSFLYQIDSFMESIMETHSFDDVNIVYQLVEEAFGEITYGKEEKALNAHVPAIPVKSPLQASRTDQGYLPASPPLTPKTDGSRPSSRGSSLDYREVNVASARSTMKVFVDYMTKLPSITSANSHDRFWFMTELRDFFLAQARQVEEKMILAAQYQETPLMHSPVFPGSKGTYYRWVSTVGSASIGSSQLFAYMCCQLGKELPAGTAWHSVEEKYLVERMNQHLAIMCRIENDMGGIRRDRVDFTVNSVNFPEFTTASPDDQDLARTLLRLAQYEREAWKRDYDALADLARGNEAKEKLVDRLRFFTGFITTYGEIHLARDPWWVRADNDSLLI